jgi:hypothetical protein
MNSKKVHFDFIRDIYIIPNTQDLLEDGLKDELWWTEDECAMIRKIASNEFEKTLKFNKTKKSKLIYKIMWYELDFDEIYKMLKTYKLTRKIELKKLCELYTIEIAK